MMASESVHDYINVYLHDVLHCTLGRYRTHSINRNPRPYDMKKENEEGNVID